MEVHAKHDLDHDISSYDGLVIRLCCTNNHAVGGPLKGSDRLLPEQRSKKKYERIVCGIPQNTALKTFSVQ